MVILPEDLLKLLLAVLIGGLVGAEREFRDKSAGFRTIIFICMGATIFTMLSLKLGADKDPVRIAASIVSGVGFLGAGAILRDARRVTGLTTASTIWLAAALGMGVGGGHYLIAGAAVLVVLIVLWIFPPIESWIDNIRHTFSYEVTCAAGSENFTELESLIAACGLRVVSRRMTKSSGEMICNWSVYGSPKAHDRLVQRLFDHAGVKEFKV